MQGKKSFLCVPLSNEGKSYICYKISQAVIVRSRGTGASTKGVDNVLTTKGYFKLKHINESYVPTIEWDALSDEDKITHFTVKNGGVFIFDSAVTPSGTLDDLVESSGNAFRIEGNSVFSIGSPLDNVELEVV